MGSPAVRHHRVLLVDDEPLLRRLFGRWLASVELDVIEATTGAEALEVLAACGGAIDLMITDNRMPGMSGVELCRRAGQRWPHLPIIMVTAFVDEVHGLDITVLEKPVPRNELLAVVEAALRQSPSRRSA